LFLKLWSFHSRHQKVVQAMMIPEQAFDKYTLGIQKQ
jgi:hypothetical protein